MVSLHPRVLHFHITSRCPYKCRHCCSDSGPESLAGELDAKSVRSMLDKALLFGMEELELSGGEPLILERGRLLDIIRYASERKMVTTLDTNTWFLDARYVLDLKEAGLDRMKSSLYGTSSGRHDDFTGIRGSFQRLTDALGFTKDTGIEVWVNYVVTPRNLDETSSLAALLEPYGVDTIQLSSIVPSGRGRTARGWVFSEPALKRAVGELGALFPDAKKGNVSFTITLFPSPERYPFRDRYCDYLKDRLVVDPDGSVVPCCILPKNFRPKAGSLLEEALEDILCLRRMDENRVFSWLSRGHKEMREALRFQRVSHNLCATCIEMFGRLAQGRA